MTGNAWAQIGLFLALILLLAKPLGAYMARATRVTPPGSRGRSGIWRRRSCGSVGLEAMKK